MHYVVSVNPNSGAPMMFLDPIKKNGGVFVWGFCEKSSWIFEFLVVVRATFSVGQRIWV